MCSELDPAFRDKPILLTHHRDGQPLDAEEGADERRSARWIRQIKRIEILSLAP